MVVTVRESPAKLQFLSVREGNSRGSPRVSPRAWLSERAMRASESHPVPCPAGFVLALNLSRPCSLAWSNLSLQSETQESSSVISHERFLLQALLRAGTLGAASLCVPPVCLY